MIEEEEGHNSDLNELSESERMERVRDNKNKLYTDLSLPNSAYTTPYTTPYTTTSYTTTTTPLTYERQLSSVYASGTLATGEIGVDTLCMPIGQCYKLNIITTTHADEVLLILCGYIADMTSINQEFCITPSGCVFTEVPVPEYYTIYDDDFPGSPPHTAPTLPPGVALPPSSSSGGGGFDRPTTRIHTTTTSPSYIYDNSTLEQKLGIDTKSVTQQVMLSLSVIIVVGIIMLFAVCITNYNQTLDKFCLFLGFTRATALYNRVQSNEEGHYYDQIPSRTSTTAGNADASSPVRTNRMYRDDFQIVDDGDDEEEVDLHQNRV